ncbi:DUF4232 domain-containing protein [Pseudokineococcus sp. 1T1Z-3]|uniref:DUF4232 domain-containing protein n=1 Tax=Pseudokineococcus sp. 1T1Z-3 TaxID=3132745 RepID=UPI0030AE5A6E
MATETLPSVPVGQDAPFRSGLVARVTAVEEADVEARGPGETSGPGRLVRLELENGSAGDVDLAGVTVLAFGEDGSSVSPISGRPTDPVQGVLAPGESASGTYAFTTPPDVPLRLEISQNAQPDIAVVEQ